MEFLLMTQEKVKKKISNELFREYFEYQSPSFLAEKVLKSDNNKNNQTVNQVMFSINKLKNDNIHNRIPEN